MNEKDFKKARTAALRLLKYRVRSKQELKQRLLLGRASKEAVKAVIADLEQLSLIDDLQFARVWIKNRVSCGFGRLRIERELFAKGVSRQIIDQGLSQEAKNIDSLAAIQALIEKRSKRYTKDDKNTAKGKLFNYLQVRGFSPEKIRLALEDL